MFTQGRTAGEWEVGSGLWERRGCGRRSSGRGRSVAFGRATSHGNGRGRGFDPLTFMGRPACARASEAQTIKARDP